MLMPSIFGENLFNDDWMDFSFPVLSTRCTASFPVLDALLCAALLSLIRKSGGSSCKKLKYFQTFSSPTDMVQ